MRRWRSPRQKAIDAAWEAGVSAGHSEAWNQNIERGFIDKSGEPKHLPMPVNREGEGPADGDDFHHVECWCGDPDCYWTVAMRDERVAGYKVGFENGSR